MERRHLILLIAALSSSCCLARAQMNLPTKEEKMFLRPAPKQVPALAAPAAAQSATGPAEQSVPAQAQRPTRVIAGIPAWEPPAPKEEPKHLEEDPGEQEAADGGDQPRNKIVRLPKVVVLGERPPVFTERQLYNDRALAARAVKKYLGSFDRDVLNRYTIPIFGISKEQRAMMLYDEEQRQKNVEELKDASDAALLTGDKAEAEMLKQESYRAGMRRQD